MKILFVDSLPYLYWIHDVCHTTVWTIWPWQRLRQCALSKENSYKILS